MFLFLFYYYNEVKLLVE